jgi:hypothetical protein
VTTETRVAARPLSQGQVAELIGRLESAVDHAETLKGIHPVYAAEANAYRQVLATIESL